MTESHDDDFDRTVTDALIDQVSDVEAGEALRKRIRDSVSDEAPAASYAHRSLLAAVAAVVVVLMAGGALAWTLATGDSDDAGLVADGGDDGQTPTTATTPDSTVDPGPGDGAVAVALPDRAVVARAGSEGLQWRLVLVDLGSGNEIATLDTIDNRVCVDEGIAACYVSYAQTAVSASGDLFVEHCCEPAGGNVERYPGLDPDTGTVGEGASYLGGFFPAVDPTGARVATVGVTAVVVRTIGEDDPGHQIALDTSGPASQMFPTGLAWSPDGASLAVSLAGPDGGRIVIVPATANTLAEGRILRDDAALAVQAWTSNGRLWVLDGDAGSVASPVRAISTTGAVESDFQVLARQVVADRTGTFLYVVTSEGLRRADPNAPTSDKLVTGATVLVPAGDEVLGAVSVFSAHTSRDHRRSNGRGPRRHRPRPRRGPQRARTRRADRHRHRCTRRRRHQSRRTGDRTEARRR